MSFWDDCCGACFAMTCGCCCCCLCTQTNNPWCLLKAPGGDTDLDYHEQSHSRMCCSCKSDDDFERTVEELYAPGTGPKPYDSTGNGNGNSTHLLELQPTSRRARRSGENERGAEGRVTNQPRPRPSMDARRPPSRTSLPEHQARDQDQDRDRATQAVPEGDRERVILESRKDAKVRTRDWIAQQSKSMDARADPARAPAGPSTSHRAHQSESHVAALQVQRPPEAYTRPPLPSSSEGFVLPDLSVRGDGSLGRMSSWSRGEKGAGGAAPVPQRGAIPATLMPGRPQNSAPSQLPFDLGPVSALGPGATQGGAPPESSPPSREVGGAVVSEGTA